jgi:diguanylate cyclase (GGDEF)-like protein/PAS domain S-box-containing protein
MSNVHHNLSEKDAQRLDAVRSYGGGNNDPDELFDRFTTLARALFNTPIALISLVGEDVVRFKSSSGIELVELPRRNILCDAVTRRCAPLIVHDANNDPRVAESRLVGTFGISFYAGVPLCTAEGLPLGAFAVADTIQRPDFTEREQTILSELARSVVAELELRHQLAEKRNMVAQLSRREEIAAIAASTPSLTAALDRLLAHIVRWVDAVYCVIKEADATVDGYFVVAGFAEDPAVHSMLNQGRRTVWRPVTELFSGAALTDQAAVDSGPIITPEQVGKYPHLAFAVSLGTRRQITLPIAIDDQRFALSIGFRETTLSVEARAICDDLAQWITPLLQGRLREDVLAQANKFLAYSNKTLQILYASREATARARDETALAQATCDLAVRFGHFSAAWVGIAEHDDRRTLRPVALAGQGIDRIFDVHVSWGDSAYGHGPSGTAVREDRPIVINDVQSTKPFALWRDDADLDQPTSIAALPLRDDQGTTFGCLTLLADNRVRRDMPGETSFDVQELRLLSQLAHDLAHGIGALRARQSRDAAIVGQNASEQRLARLLEASQTVIYALERPGDTNDPAQWPLIEISGNVERLYGHDPVTARAAGWRIDHLHPDDRDDVLAAERQLLVDGSLVHRYRFARNDGTYRWVRDEKSLLPGAPGRADTIVGAWVDITEKHQADQVIRRLAFFDTLTDLPNLAQLYAQLGKALTIARQSGQHGSLMVVALNGVEAIHDLHGPTVGDAVLRQVGRTLLTGLRKQDIVARIRSDKFAILLAPLADTPQQAAEITQRIAEKLLGTLAEPIHAAGRECYISADVGIAMVPGRAGAVEDIVRQAEMAVRQARASDRTPIIFFEARMQDQIAERHLIELALRDALAHDRFEVWLQSQVDQNGVVTGAEALIRLRRPDGVILQPNDFITIAEETGIVFAMGRWMLRAVCTIIAEQAARAQPLRVSINVSPRQFRDPNFIADIEAALATTGADAHYLMIEITESLLIDRIDETTLLLNALAARGIQFSVDDFGTGYSSLGYLQNLPIAEIKIDRSFIQRLPDNPRDATLAEAILAMTRHLGLVTVAEGVESEAQATFLRDRGCDVMQGFLFGRPEPAAVWLDRWGVG